MLTTTLTTTETILCDLAAPGIEVVTARKAAGEIVATIHGGRLDGDQFRSAATADLTEKHERACRLVRLLAGAKRR